MHKLHDPLKFLLFIDILKFFLGNIKYLCECVIDYLISVPYIIVSVTISGIFFGFLPLTGSTHFQSAISAHNLMLFTFVAPVAISSTKHTSWNCHCFSSAVNCQITGKYFSEFLVRSGCNQKQIQLIQFLKFFGKKQLHFCFTYKNIYIWVVKESKVYFSFHAPVSNYFRALSFIFSLSIKTRNPSSFSPIQSTIAGTHSRHLPFNIDEIYKTKLFFAPGHSFPRTIVQHS